MEETVTKDSIDESDTHILDSKADWVVHFWHIDNITFSKPTVNSLFTLKSIDNFKHGDRNIAIIYLDKRSPPEGKGATNDELIDAFRKLGFRRVIIKQSMGDVGGAILYDSNK